MDLKHLRSFCALGETLHFGRAAARLNIVQPAVSAHIRQIEDELGIKLVERSRHHVFMTPAGRNFLQEARSILQQVSGAIDTTRNIAAGTAGILRVGFVSSAIALFVTHLIRHFSTFHPDVEVDLYEMNSYQQLEAIAEGRLDLGFVRMPIQRDQVEIKTVAREPFEAILPVGHPLSRHPTMRPMDFSDETIFMLARDNAPGFHDALLSAFHLNHTVPRRIKYFREFQTAIHLASAGLGIAVVPRYAAAIAPQHIARVPLNLGDNYSEIGLALKDPSVPLIQKACEIIDKLTDDGIPADQNKNLA
ncbi:LysR family transcriptional regulator [Kozakia baliensis]|uniref:LysR family transcriptional regulator n=1 Tax=Kozakia baliensis TaxID=153496 RepID=UPI0008793B77|nr:LysR family transcriptional regulator [Kozakia baliensis]AOX19007.1 hypothetical protein A0U90_00350 [Kozakia baliensis]